MNTSVLSMLQDKQADLIIRGYVDDVMERVMEGLEIPIPSVCPDSKPIEQDSENTSGIT